MKHSSHSGIRQSVALVMLAALAAIHAPDTVSAQAQPTAEQMRMINSLPPAQRDQAMQAIRQMQSQDGTSTQGQSTISEELTPLPDEQAEADSTFDLTELEPLRAESGSRLVIDLIPKEALTLLELMELEDDPILSRLRGSKYYVLNEFGVLDLPGLDKVLLLGLTEEAIAQRLGAIPDLEYFDVSASLLEMQPIGTDALEPFGYDVFVSDQAGFQPVMSGPVPPDYVLGPGDSIRVQLFGNSNGIYEFEVSRDGVLNLPEIGPITVVGLPFSEFREDLNNRVREMLIGTQVSVSMGALRTIRVFVLGDVNRPGSYVVSSLSTISSALYSSGGISDIGTLRNIQLKRQGETVATLDLYELLLKGDTSGDQRLQPTDVIFVPPIGDTIGIAGAVRRPAIYELKGNTSIGEAVSLAGGLSSDAYPKGARLQRIDSVRDRIVLSFDLSQAGSLALPVSGGDILLVPDVLPELSNSVFLEGSVQRPGPYQWRDGMRLVDLIPSALALQSGADSDYILVRRESGRDRTVSVVTASLDDAYTDPNSENNIELQPRDRVHVFSLAFGRQRIIAPIMEELQRQARSGEPLNLVQVGGEVRAPGDYPLAEGMRISDLIRAGGNLAEQAFSMEAELTRFAVVNGEYRAKEVLDIDLRAVMAGSESDNIALVAHDHLRIDLLPNWNSNWEVSLQGEVKFPGEYQVLKGETLTQLIQRAGGLTEQAFPEGAIFLRESLREREREQMEVLARRMETDLASMSLENIDTTGAEALSIGQSLLEQLRNIEPVGRLVIDIEQITARAGGEQLIQDIELRDGDQLLVPITTQEVTVIGEVQQPTSHIFQPGLTREDYISLSGGLNRKGDKKLIYVVRASGAVISSSGSGWFGRNQNAEIRAGDTIVVPLETDRIRPLTFWTNVTQILYQGAIAVAAIKTFSN